MVERVEIDVAQQRAHHGTLWRAPIGCPLPGVAQNSLIEEAPDQRQEAAIHHLSADHGHQAAFRDRAEVVLQIGIDDMYVTRLEQLIHPPQRALAPSSGAKAVAVRGEIPLE